MLGKLLKYDIKSIARILLPVYAALVLATAVGKILISIPAVMNLLNGAVAGIMMMTYVLLIVGVFVLTLFVIIQRYYLNMLCDEGYLTHTLPATPATLILSKLINALMWTLASTILVLSCLFVLVSTNELWKEIPEAWALATKVWNERMGFSFAWFITTIVVTALVGATTQILMFFCAMSLGQSFTHQKLLGSIASYIGLNFVMQIISLVTLLFTQKTYWGVFQNDMNFEEVAVAGNVMLSFLWTACILQVIYATIYFFATRYFMTKKLNLQ